MVLPRILLFGKSGQVGWELRRALAPMAEVVAVGSGEVNLTDPDAVRSAVREAAPAVVINAAAYTAVDKAESDAETAMLVNGEAPGWLAEETKRLGVLLVHYSTDYVFDGDGARPYAEEDAPGPVGVYGRSKLAGERAVQAVGGAHLIFRLCWVYGARGQNFFLTMRRLARERERLRVVRDQIGSPTWSRDIATATALAVRQTLGTGDPAAFTGLYHLAAAGHTSWHGFASRIVEGLAVAERKCTVVEAIPTSEYPTPARRPAYSVLCCDRLERVFGLRLPGWERSLEMVVESL